MKIELLFFFLFTTFLLKANKEPTSSPAPKPDALELAELTNLALREVGHELLKIAGNDSATIMPIQQPDEHLFLLTLQESFYYDTLPFLLHTALEGFEMESESYYVSVKDCNVDTIILGYDVRQFLAGKVPCIGRHQYALCNNVFVNFPERKVAHSMFTSNYLYLMLIGIFLLFGMYYWAEIGKLNRSRTKIAIKQNDKLDLPNQVISFGNSRLDPSNQLLYIHEIKSSITYREAKLLQYLVNHSNQLLPRQAILDQVWGEEGVMVGRSLDVFVSRLRKLLKSDTTLRIKAVHGVGYRLEIKANSYTANKLF